MDIALSTASRPLRIAFQFIGKGLSRLLRAFADKWIDRRASLTILHK